MLDGKYPHKSNQEMSLAGMVIWRTGDANLAAKTVAWSETTEKSNWSEAELEEKQKEIIQWYPKAVETDRHSANGNNNDNESDTGNDTSSNQEYTSQRRRSNEISNPSQLDPDAERKRSMRKDLFGK